MAQPPRGQLSLPEGVTPEADTLKVISDGHCHHEHCTPVAPAYLSFVKKPKHRGVGGK